MIDTHCHLYMPPLSADVPAVIDRARARGVTDIVVPAYDRASWDDMAAFATMANVHTAYGLHPWLAHEPLPGGGSDAFLGALASRLDATAAVAIGEIGLDTKITSSGLREQMPLLEAQLQLAVDRDLPVILHCRGAFEELLGAVAAHGGRLRGVVHAFSRGPELGQRILAAGLHVAFGGAVTRPRAKRPRRSALRLPLAGLLLETDAPSIGLDGIPPERAEPAHVAEVAAALAAIRDCEVGEIAAATTANARTLFRLPDRREPSR
jgi:TatD DNase family protein